MQSFFDVESAVFDRIKNTWVPVSPLPPVARWEFNAKESLLSGTSYPAFQMFPDNLGSEVMAASVAHQRLSLSAYLIAGGSDSDLLIQRLTADFMAFHFSNKSFGGLVAKSQIQGVDFRFGEGQGVFVSLAQITLVLEFS